MLKYNKNRGSAMDKKELLDQLAGLHTTEMGTVRIKRNLKLTEEDAVEFCKEKILDKQCLIYRQGKNWYCINGNIRITINAGSLTIITAHLIQGEKG